MSETKYRDEIKAILIEKGLKPDWAQELIDGETNYLTVAFKKGTSAISAAFDVYITEQDSAREPEAEDLRMKLDVSGQAKSYLEQLVKIGLWGDSVEAVATTLVHQQLAAKLEAGLIKTVARR